jgi:hypothetical protein
MPPKLLTPYKRANPPRESSARNTRPRNSPPEVPPPQETPRQTARLRSASHRTSSPARKVRDIPLSEITPPPPAAGQHFAMYITIAETVGVGSAGRQPDDPKPTQRPSTLVVLRNADVNQCVSYNCLESATGMDDWFFHKSFVNPQTGNYGLLAMVFVAWIPSARVKEVEALLAKMPIPQRRPEGWNSQHWAQSALKVLATARILTNSQAEVAYLKQQKASILPYKGLLPNLP